MIDTKELRRLAQAATPGPWHATKSVETNSWAVWSDTTRLMELRPTKTVDMYRVSNTAAFIAAANPAAISELLDRLEAAEKAVTEAYRRGYATGQEEVEKERDQFKSDWLECLKLAEEAKPIIDRQRSEIDALRAKIEAMERLVALPDRITPEQAPPEIVEYAPIAAEGYADGWNACMKAIKEKSK